MAHNHSYRLTHGYACGVFASFALFCAFGSPGPAIAAGPDCPDPQAALEVQAGWLADAKATAGIRILAIGSSSTQGIGASGPSFTYPAQLQSRLSALLGQEVEVDNQGIGGETIRATVGRLQAALTAGKPDLVIWQVGTNDAVIGEDETAFRDSLQQGLSALRAAKAPFVLLDPQFYPGLRDVARYERYVHIIHEMGALNGAAVFSRYALMKAWGGEPGGVLGAMLSKDQFHMSDRGYGCLARDLAIDLAPFWRPHASQAGGATSG